MTIQIKQGDLVYIPSEVVLHNTKGTEMSYMRLTRPINVLVLSVEQKTVNIFLDGQRWKVDRESIYSVSSTGFFETR